MKKVTKYYSFDNKQFETEEECAKYEKATFDLMNNAALFFDEDFNLIENDLLFKRIMNYEMSYIYVKDEKLCDQAFDSIEHYTGTCIYPDEGYSASDIIYYDYDRDEWRNLTRQFNELKFKSDKIMCSVVSMKTNKPFIILKNDEDEE